MTAVPDYAAMDLAELKAELDKQRAHMETAIFAARLRASEECQSIYTGAAEQLRELLTDGIDHQHATDILWSVAALLDAEALMERKIGPLAGLIFGAHITSGDFPVLFEATPDVIRATPTYHLMEIVESVVGLEDAATDDDIDAEREAQDEERAQARDEADDCDCGDDDEAEA